MKYIEDEDTIKLHDIGKKIQQMRELNKELTEFFIKDNNEPVYEESQDILDMIKLYAKGEDINYIGEAVFQSDGEPVEKLLDLFGIKVKPKFLDINDEDRKLVK
jgi:hypothetical protein